MPAKRKTAAPKEISSSATGFEAKLWLAADDLRNNMDAAEPSGARQPARQGSPQGLRRSAEQYLLARSGALRTHAIQNMTGTSGRQRVPSECFNTFWLAVPPPEVARRFDELTAPLMAKIKGNADQSSTLATLRDTLLPKLLSGELSGELSVNGTVA